MVHEMLNCLFRHIQVPDIWQAPLPALASIIEVCTWEDKGAVASLIVRRIVGVWKNGNDIEESQI